MAKKEYSKAQIAAFAKWKQRQYYWKKSKQKRAKSTFDLSPRHPAGFFKQCLSEINIQHMYKVSSDEELESLRLTSFLLINLVEKIKDTKSTWADKMKVERSALGQLKFYYISLIEYNYPILVHDMKQMDKLDKACKMSMKDYIASCKSGALIDTDGEGVYATKDHVIENLVISPSQIKNGWQRPEFEYVCWYNK